MVLAKFSSSTPDDLGDIILPLPQLGVVALVLVDDGVAHLVEEGLVDAQQLAVAGGPAEQAAEHIAPALVGGAARRRRS